MRACVCVCVFSINCVRTGLCVRFSIYCVRRGLCMCVHPPFMPFHLRFPEPSVAQPPHPNPSSPTPIIDSKAKIHYDNNDELLMMVITTELAVRVALISHAYIHKRSNSAGGEQQIRT